MTASGAALPRVPHRELVTYGRELEALGFDELWLVEDCFQYGGVSSAAAILATSPSSPSAAPEPSTPAPSPSLSASPA